MHLRSFAGKHIMASQRGRPYGANLGSMGRNTSTGVHPALTRLELIYKVLLLLLLLPAGTVPHFIMYCIWTKAIICLICWTSTDVGCCRGPQTTIEYAHCSTGADDPYGVFGWSNSAVLLRLPYL